LGLGTRIQVAAHRRHVADDGIRDHLAGVEQQGIAPLHDLGLLEVDLAREAADAKCAAILTNVGQAREAVDVDDVPRTGQTQLHQRNETLTAREDLRVVPEPGEQRGDLAERGGSVVFECARNHRGDPFLGSPGGQARDAPSAPGARHRPSREAVPRRLAPYERL
jgi:hypothetical protein